MTDTGDGAAGATPGDTDTRRTPLNRDRVVRAAIAFADEHGLDALSMRKLGQQLGVEAMSLYNHVKNKDDLLDGIIDVIVREIEVPEADVGWKTAMRDRAYSAREVFTRHPWAVALMETRTTPGPATLQYYESVLRCLREGGLSIDLAAHAFSALDSYIYGFIAQEQSLPFDSSEDLSEIGPAMLAQMADAFPHLTEMTKRAMQPDYSYAAEFGFGLELILDALEQAATKDA